MRFLFDARHRVHPLTRWLALAGITGLIGLALITVVEVLSRWLFNAPIRGHENIVDLVIPIVVACCFPVALLHGHNVTVRFLGNRLGRDRGEWLEVFGIAVTLVFFALLAWQISVYAHELAATHRLAEIIRVPIAPSWWAVTGVIVLCVPVQAIVFLARLGLRGTGRYAELVPESVIDAMEAESPDRSG